MSAGTALFTMSAFQAVTQITGGYAQKEEYKANAAMLDSQADLIGIKGDIEQGQLLRFRARTAATATAAVGKSGVMLSGSPMAVMVDTDSQIRIDQAISRFNYNMEKSYKSSEADAMRRKAKLAVYGGWSDAFSTALTGAANYAMYRGMGSGKKTSTASPTTFDSTPSYHVNFSSYEAMRAGRQ